MTIEAYERQAGMLPVDALKYTPISVVGVGAVGRQVAHQLYTAGARTLSFYDPDVVDKVNLGPQGWKPDDVGRPKVQALADELSYLGAVDEEQGRELFDDDDGYEQMCFYTKHFPLGGVDTSHVLFCCVDSIETRERIFHSQRDNLNLFLDSRVVGDTIHILAADDDESFDYYPTSLFRPEDAFRGSCTTRMSCYAARIASGMLVLQMSKYLRGIPVDRHTVFNLLAMELYTK